LAVSFKGEVQRHHISGFPVTMENLLQRAACL